MCIYIHQLYINSALPTDFATTNENNLLSLQEGRLTLLGVSGDTLSYIVSPGGDLIFHFSPMYIQPLSRRIYATPLSIRAVSFFMVVGMLLYSFVV